MSFKCMYILYSIMPNDCSWWLIILILIHMTLSTGIIAFRIGLQYVIIYYLHLNH